MQAVTRFINIWHSFTLRTFQHRLKTSACALSHDANTIRRSLTNFWLRVGAVRHHLLSEVLLVPQRLLAVKQNARFYIKRDNLTYVDYQT